MMNHLAYAFCLAIMMTYSCSVEKASDPVVVTAEGGDPASTHVQREQHEYGGWYCPNNLRGFPPMDIQDLHKIPVITDRLPTKAETQDGRSLIYVDPILHPDARPLDISLPKLGRTYSRTGGDDEVVIVIQAVIIGVDTIVGYRYPTGGNGSGWYDEITWLTDAEVDALGATPYAYVDVPIAASKEDVWDAITMTDYASGLGKTFGKEEAFSTSWEDGRNINLEYDHDGDQASGSIRGMWGAIYMDVKYKRPGYESVEKMVLLPGPDNSARLQFVAGPYPADQALQQKRWDAWADEVRGLSER
jgi:hypothetical protein